MEVMKKYVLSFMVVIGMVIGAIMPIKAETIKPIRSNTMINANNLFACGSEYERVQVVYKGESTPKFDGVVIERYNANFDLLNQKALNLSLITPTGCTLSDFLWGGVYEGSNYNFILTGSKNFSQDKNKKVIRVTRFNKDWSYSAFAEWDYNTIKVSQNAVLYTVSLWEI